MSETEASTQAAASLETGGAPERAAPSPQSTRTGPGRLLVAVYGLFALSAFAGVVYIVATVTLVNGNRTARRIAFLSCSVELAGVLAVGTWSVLDPASFPDATVWSTYGVGYGFVPLVLPVFGLLWLRRWSRRSGTVPAADLPDLRREQD